MSAGRQARPAAEGNAIGPDAPLRIGISACLLGQEVRFDGGHKRDPFLVETFGRYVEWVPVCPEVEAGLGVPRESMHLRRADDGVLLVGTKSGVDHTDRLQRYAARRVAALGADDLSGYVLKKNSPSCGMERVKVYGQSGPVARGRGLFAVALLEAFPHLPVEEEGRLNDPRLRENFVERVFAYRRLRSLFRSRWTIGDVVAFHTAHKLQLMAHAPRLNAELGRLVAGAKAMARQALQTAYEAQFMKGLETMATPRRHVNVLHHILGYFSDRLDRAARSEMVDVIEDYGRGLLPLVVPITMVRHHVRRLAIAYLEGQTYLDPHPKELMLRNHV
jgi:uncharacterized protein YbgA (DUF1722 family)/uncharacterized protein YbbK (DUF523 family)